MDNRVLKELIGKFGCGGRSFKFEGVIDSIPKPKENKETGEFRASINIVYVGGGDYLTLSDGTQAEYLRVGDFITGEAEARDASEWAVNAQGKNVKVADTVRNGSLYIVAVNGQPWEVFAKSRTAQVAAKEVHKQAA